MVMIAGEPATAGEVSGIDCRNATSPDGRSAGFRSAQCICRAPRRPDARRPLIARSRSPGLRLAAGAPAFPAEASGDGWGCDVAAYSCGGSRRLEPEVAPGRTTFPFHFLAEALRASPSGMPDPMMQGRSLPPAAHRHGRT